jgi:hypothetical protein
MSCSIKKVSIILLNYNGYEDTIECLKSLQKLQYSSLEVIVVDNKSPDNSVSEIKSFLSENCTYNEIDNIYISPGFSIKFILSDFNGGYGFGNNIGINYAINNGADYLLVLNNDVLVTPDFIEPLLKRSIQNHNIGILCGKILYHPEVDKVWFSGGSYSLATGRTKHFNFNKLDKNIKLKEQDKTTFISGCCWFIPSAVINKVGLIDDSYFMYAEDLEFCHRVQKHGYTLEYVPESIIYHKVGSTTGRDSDFSVFWCTKNTIRFLYENSPFVKYIFSIPFYTATMALLYLKRRQPLLLIPLFKGFISTLKYIFFKR